MFNVLEMLLSAEIMFVVYSVCSAERERIKISIYGGLSLQGEVLVRASTLFLLMSGLVNEATLSTVYVHTTLTQYYVSAVQ